MTEKIYLWEEINKKMGLEMKECRLKVVDKNRISVFGKVVAGSEYENREGYSIRINAIFYDNEGIVDIKQSDTIHFLDIAGGSAFEIMKYSSQNDTVTKVEIYPSYEKIDY